jgi:hypothetical protein
MSPSSPLGPNEPWNYSSRRSGTVTLGSVAVGAAPFRECERDCGADVVEGRVAVGGQAQAGSSDRFLLDRGGARGYVAADDLVPPHRATRRTIAQILILQTTQVLTDGGPNSAISAAKAQPVART